MMKTLYLAVLLALPGTANAICSAQATGLQLDIPNFNDPGVVWATCMRDNFITINDNATSTTSFQVALDEIAIATTTLDISTTALQALVDTIGISTDTLQGVQDVLGVSTDTLQGVQNALGISTGTLQGQIDSNDSELAQIGIDTATLRSVQNALGISTSSLQSLTNALGVSTDTLQGVQDALGISTDTLQGVQNALGISTDTLQNVQDALGISTDTLQSVQDDLGVSTDSIASGVGLDPGAVTTSKLGDSSVTTVKINLAAVTTSKLAPDAVTTAKIADDAVTKNKIAADGCTDGQILKLSGSVWTCAADAGSGGVGESDNPVWTGDHAYSPTATLNVDTGTAVTNLYSLVATTEAAGEAVIHLEVSNTDSCWDMAWTFTVSANTDIFFRFNEDSGVADYSWALERSGGGSEGIPMDESDSECELNDSGFNDVDAGATFKGHASICSDQGTNTTMYVDYHLGFQPASGSRNLITGTCAYTGGEALSSVDFHVTAGGMTGHAFLTEQYDWR